MTTEYIIKWINDAKGALDAGATADQMQKKFKRLEKELKNTGKAGKKAADVNKDMAKSFMGLTFSTKDFTKALARVAVVAPIWMAFRLILRTVTTAIKDAATAYFDFQKEMGRVATVTKTVGATAEEFEKLEKAAISFAVTSTSTMKESATAIYQLSTAGLSATEAIEGFEHVMNLALGTMTDVNQTGKLMAGAFKLFGKEMGTSLTVAEKFQKISDVLATTFQTQQVELSEIATAFSFAANAANSIDFEFTDLVATIGFLNSGLLKGSKAGTSLTNAMIKMSKNANLLEDMTGRAFDPAKPIEFVATMRALNKRFQEGKLALTDDVKTINAFGIRGVRAIKSILQRWDEWEDALARNKGNVEGAAKDMRIAFEDNITAQLELSKQQFGELSASITTKVDGAIVPSLKNWNKHLANITTAINENDIPKISAIYTAAVTGNMNLTNQFVEVLEGVRGKFSEIGSAIESSGFIKLLDRIRDIKVVKWAEKLTQDLMEALGITKLIAKIQEKVTEDVTPKRTFRLEPEFKRDMELLKAGGATALQLAQETVDYLTLEKGLGEDINSVLNARNKLEAERIKLLVSQAKEVRKMVSSSLSEAIKSGDIESFAASLGTKLRETVIDNVSEGLVNSIANLTDLDVIFGQALEGTKIERAIITGADYHGNVITNAMMQGAKAGGNVGGVLPGGGTPGITQGVATLFSRDDGTTQVPIAKPGQMAAQGQPQTLMQKGKGMFDSLGGLGGIASMGMLGMMFSSGGKGKSSMGHTYSGNIGSETSTASTRSTTVAKVTNIQISPSFILDGASINDENTIRESAQRMVDLMREDLLRILEDADVATGNV